MKLITSKKEKNTFNYHIKNSLRNVVIVLSYTIGFTLYALFFLIWKVDFHDISLWWISVPIIGFILGITHMLFIYKGSLTCRAITMFVIMFFVFVIPFAITFI